MKSFYSLIKIAPNEMSGDSLTIGLILSSISGFKLMFSKNKMKLSKSLLTIEPTVIDFIVHEINNKVHELNKCISLNNDGLSELETLLNSEYFSYLSKYSNGLLKFSAPNIIADDIDDVKFKKLFSLFVEYNILEKDNVKPSKEAEQLFLNKVNIKLT